MKARNGMGLPILAIIVGMGMIVAAVSTVRLSNIVSNDNQVGLPVTIQVTSTSTTPGGDLPDYAAGMVALDVSYDMKVSYTTSKALTTASIIVEFSKTGINVTDVVMNWTDAGSWSTISWTDNGNVLHSTLGYVGTLPAGANVNYYATLIYTVTGSFNFKVWVEGSL
jgi:hypothetical protein